jgi:hypothetical protein
MIPHERSLVEKYRDAPFVILGVNSDEDLAMVRAEQAKHGVTWRSFWNGPKGTAGPIAASWAVSGWPALYILDPEGVIRYSSVGADERAIEATIEALLEETRRK